MRKETKGIKLNLYPQDYEKIKIAAQSLSMTMAQYIRHLTNTKLVSDRKKVVTQIEKDTLRELNHIGVNLNQIAKRLNQDNKIDSYVLQALENISQYIQDKTL